MLTFEFFVARDDRDARCIECEFVRTISSARGGSSDALFQSRFPAGEIDNGGRKVFRSRQSSRRYRIFAPFAVHFRVANV